MKKRVCIFLSEERKCSCYFRLTVFLFLLSSPAFSQVQLVKDVNNFGDPYFSEFGFLKDVNGTLFFQAYGNLYKTNGTPETTELLKPSAGISSIRSYQGMLIFGADGLWKSDGTIAGTVKIKNVTPTQAAYDLNGIYAEVNGVLYFSANDGVSGVELWKTDGTTAGTVLVKDIKPGATSSFPVNLTEAGGKLFFAAPSGNNKGIELWVSDGTTAGTQMVLDIYPGSNSSDPGQFASAGGILYFVAKDGVHGRELWKSNGTAAGTMMIKDIRPGSIVGGITDVTACGSNVFFAANDGVHGKELWKSDGTAAGTVLVKDITPGPASSSHSFAYHISDMVSYNGLVFFECLYQGHKLWRSDGTDAGTFPLTGGTTFEFVRQDYAGFNGHLYFLVQQDYDVTICMRTDGTVSGTTIVDNAFSDFQYGTFSQLESSGTTLYHITQEHLEDDAYGSPFFSGPRLTKSDGTLAGRVDVFNNYDVTLSSDPRRFCVVEDNMYFAAYEGEMYVDRLWKTDGTASGTVRVRDMGEVRETVALGSKLIFTGYINYYEPRQLWASDGTEAGTAPISNNVSGVDPSGLLPVGDVVYFSGDDPASSARRELWKTDGTLAGTVLVKDINPSPGQPSNPTSLCALGTNVIFAATTDANGTELWKSDGTDAGTILVKDISSSGSSSPSDITNAGSNVLFIANDGVVGNQIWKSDGTTAGTTMLMSITGSPLFSGFVKVGGGVIFTVVNYGTSGILYFSDGTIAGTIPLKTFDSSHQNLRIFGDAGAMAFVQIMDQTSSQYLSELWRTDGTVAGTVKLLGPRYLGYPQYTAALDGIHYLSIDGTEPGLWRTDGTSCGTYRIPDPELSQVGELMTLGSHLLFSGTETEEPYFSNFGTELYEYLPEAPLPCMALARTATGPEAEDVTLVDSYPNPFHDHFNLNISGKENEKYAVRFFTMNGKAMESRHDLDFNTAFSFGDQWDAGVYVMKVVVNGKMITQKIIKIN